MDANRLGRFTIAGWAFMLSWIVHHWVFGKGIDTIFEALPNTGFLPTAVAGVLIAFAASPFLGLVISSIAYTTMQIIRKGDVEFDVPRPEEFARFVVSLTTLIPTYESKISLRSIIPSQTYGKRWWHRRKLQHAIDEILPYFNLVFHGRAPSSLIQYTTRRWTMYWMYANSICAIFLGILFALVTAGNPSGRQPVPWYDVRYAIEAGLCIFVLVGRKRMQHLRKQVYDLAWKWLYVEAGH